MWEGRAVGIIRVRIDVGNVLFFVFFFPLFLLLFGKLNLEKIESRHQDPGNANMHVQIIVFS